MLEQKAEPHERKSVRITKQSTRYAVVAATITAGTAAAINIAESIIYPPSIKYEVEYIKLS